MTDDSLTVAGQSHLTDAFLWLVGAPLCLLDALYLSRLAPPLSAERPETLILWVLGIAALALLAWSLLCSACAHLALLRVAPPAARTAARFFVCRCGTRLSRSLLARAGASALIGSTLVTGAPAAASLAAPQEQTSPAVSLTWADTPGADTDCSGHIARARAGCTGRGYARSPYLNHGRAGRFTLVDRRLPAPRRR